jgi:hypothetical protein
MFGRERQFSDFEVWPQTQPNSLLWIELRKKQVLPVSKFGLFGLPLKKKYRTLTCELPLEITP